MKTRFTVALSMVAGIAIGAVAIQGLHAQAKPKAYVVSETEIVDEATVKVHSPLVRAATDAAGGRKSPLPAERPLHSWARLPSALASKSGKVLRRRRHSAIQQPTRIWLRSVIRP